MSRRGSVILHVLVTGVIVALIAACILRVTMSTSLLTARTNSSTAQKRLNEGGYSILMTYWNSQNQVCSSGVNYSCSGTAGTCNCTCTNGNSVYPTIKAATIGGQCQITVSSNWDTVGNIQSDGSTHSY